MAPTEITLQAADGEHYVCAEPDGRLVADRPVAGPWETFTAEPLDEEGVFALRTAHSTYLCAELNGEVSGDRLAIGPWERWAAQRVDGGVALRSIHGGYLVAEGGGGREVRADRFYDAPGPWEIFRTPGTWPVQAQPTQPAYRQPVGRVRLVGRGLADDAGLFLGGTCSYFHGPRTFERSLTRFGLDVATMVQMRADAARIITDLGWPGDREQDGPSGIPRLIATMDALWACGIRTQVTIFGSLFGARYESSGATAWGVRPYRLDTQPARLRYVEALCDALQGREDRILLIEVCNEPENGGVGPLSRPDLVDLQRVVRRKMPGILVSLGAPGGALGATTWTESDFQWYGQYSDVVLPHLDRGYRSLGYGHAHQGIEASQQGRPWGDNEPIGPRSSVAAEDNPTKLRLGRTFAWATNAAYTCWHAFSGIGLDPAADYPLAQDPGWAHAFDARAVLPADLPNYRFHNWHWGTNPFETLDGCWADHPNTQRGTIRTLGLTKDRDRVIAVLKVAPQGCRVRTREALHLTMHLHDGDRYVAAETRDYGRGEAFELPAGAEDVLFVGHAL